MSDVHVNSGQGHFLARLLAPMVFLALAINFLCGCSKSTGTTPVASSSSVSELLAKLPILKPLGIESCRYTIEKNSAASRLPSPSDVRVEIKGLAVLSESGSKTLKSSYEWKSIRRDDIPKSLLTILPPGDVLISEKLNESFADNHPNLTHGFVVTLVDNSWSRVYFLATDMDHLIKP